MFTAEVILLLAAFELLVWAHNLPLHFVRPLSEIFDSAWGLLRIFGLLILSRGLERLEAAVEVFMRRATTLLEISRIASGRIELHPSHLDLSALTAETIERYAPLAAMARTSITMDAPPSIMGFWDKGALEQILENLISNAFKYADQKPIDVAIFCENGKVRVDVRDRGIGMENPEAAFDNFLKTESSAGFGVGLWVVRHLCEAMEGSATAKSAPGQGSTFTVTLPLNGTAPNEHHP